MKYDRMIKLKNGAECHLRSGTEQDGQAVLALYQLTHSETDFLLSYPEEHRFDLSKESQFLKDKAESDNEVEIVAVVDGVIVGSAGISAVGTKYKVRHRAQFGISIVKAFWGLGIGTALTDACISCARDAGYVQLELTVVADNASAMALYRKAGFIEYGRNPKGFCSKTSGFQEVVSMRLEL